MKMSIREAINQTLHEEMARDDRVVVMGEDVASDQGGVYGITEGLTQKYGVRRVIDTPITESAIVGAAGGAALPLFEALASFRHGGVEERLGGGGDETALPLDHAHAQRARADTAPRHLRGHHRHFQHGPRRFPLVLAVCHVQGHRATQALMLELLLMLNLGE